jgi:hypothetical protein
MKSIKPARDMRDEELAALEVGLKTTALKHSPVCNCQICHRYTEVGLEILGRRRPAKEAQVPCGT